MSSTWCFDSPDPRPDYSKLLRVGGRYSARVAFSSVGAPGLVGQAAFHAKVLHNMSAPPRTTVTAIVAVVGDALVRFRADRSMAVGTARRATLAAELDAYWEEAAFTGAALVYRNLAAEACGDVEVVEADRFLALNVICRQRAGLLLPGTPLDLDRIEDTIFASDDPRLVAVARRER